MSRTQKHYFLKGVVPILFAASCWGVSYFIRKCIVDDIGTFTIVFMYSIGATVFLALVGFKRYRGVYGRLKKKWKPVTLMALMSITVGASAMTFGMQYIDLGVATILEKSQTIFAIILASLYLRETLAKRSIFLGLVGIIGAIGIVPFQHSSISTASNWQVALGAVSVTFAAFVWALSGVMGRKLSLEKTKALDMALARALVGIATGLPLVLVFDAVHINIAMQWKSMMLSSLGGVIGGGVGFIAYYYGLKTISAGVSSMFELVTPMIGVMLGFIFFHEHMSMRQWICGFILLGSVLGLIWIESLRHRAVVEASIETQA